MKKTAVLRVSADLCFYFSILHVFTAFRPWRLAMALFVAACFGLGFVIVNCRSKALRLLLSLLPGLCFLLADLSFLLVFPVLAWLYYILVMTAGNYAVPLDEYRRSFQIELVIALFFVAANIFHGTLYRGHVLTPESLVYVFLFLCLGVFAMRAMQMGATMDRTWQLSNALTVIGVPVAAVGGAVVIYLILRFLTPGVRYLFAPIGRFFTWLFLLIFKGEGAAQEYSIIRPFSNQSIVQATELPIEGDLEHEGTTDPNGYDPYLIERAATVGAYVVIGLLLLLALWLIIRYAKRNRPDDESEELYYEETVEGAPPAGKRRRRKKSAMLFGPARQIRRTYALYLEHVRARGLQIGVADTSQDVLDHSQSLVNGPEAARLREIYIAARYGNPSAITREQAQEAQRCLDAILGESK